MGGLVSEEKPDAKGQGDEIAKGGPNIEEKDGDQRDEVGGF
jgi:hypothetical protein